LKNKKLFAILTLVCFMMTLMPVAAFAADADVSVRNSYIYQTDDKTSVTNTVGTKDGVKFTIDVNNAQGKPESTSVTYVWVTDSNGAITEATVTPANETAKIYNVYEVAGGVEEVTITFPEAGDYTVYAGIAKKDAVVSSTSNIAAFADPYKITVRPSAAADPDYYYAEGNEAKVQGKDSVKTTPVATAVVDANGVASNKIKVTFTDKDGALKGKTVSIESTSAAVTTDKTSAKTGNKGTIEFTVAGTIEGTYYVELTLDGVTWFVKVTVGDTGATYIETVEQPRAAQALYGNLNKIDQTGTKVRFSITDINGNNVDSYAGMTGIKNNGIDTKKAVAGSYIVLTEKPEASELESENLELKYNKTTREWYLDGVGTLDAEGTYSVKVILDNGATATATWEVKKFQTPVQLRIDTAVNTVALGASIGAQLTYVDANGVEKNATDAKLAATGYAVANVVGNTVTAKSDEKYVGEKITVSAVSERYNLVATKEYTVVGEAVAVAFVDKTVETNVNNRLEWNLVDESGARIAINNGLVKDITISYVVLDKPEGAKVTVTDATNKNDLMRKGIGKMALTSNKVGNVAVQVIVTANYNAQGTAVTQTKYYTGTQIFAVGNGSVGDVVVMSVGSNEIVINDAKATIDAAPIVKNDRTFVPFRALAEAFGAEVAYDEATQAVTAELNGVKVVMTIGSATYTVNGAEKTMDVAPFINGSRTMVPVRFVAEAFGIKVIPTYDENGATADILFNL